MMTQNKYPVKYLLTYLRDQPWMSLAMVSYWILISLVYQTTVYFQNIDIYSMSIPSQIPIIAISFFTYFAITIMYRKKRISIPNTKYLLIVSLLLSLGVLFSYLYQLNFYLEVSLLFYVLACLLIGVNQSIFCIEIQRVYGVLGSDYVVVHSCLGLLVSALVLMISNLIPYFLLSVLFALLPFFIFYGIFRTVKNSDIEKAVHLQGQKVNLNIPYKFLITAFIHGLSLGILIKMMPVSASYEIILGFIYAPVLMIVIFIFTDIDYNHLIYQLAFPIIAFGAFVISVFAGYKSLGLHIQFMGYCFLHLSMWGVCAYLIKKLHHSATWVIAISTCFFMLGQLVGSIVIFIPETFWYEFIGPSFVFLTLLAALLMMSNENLRTGWGLAKVSPLSIIDVEYKNLAEKVADQYLLSERETDVIYLLARGKNRKRISEELYIGEETVKSHTQNIYKKLGVHSQQELIELFENI